MYSALAPLMDWFFQRASDRDGQSYLARISPDVVWALFWLTVLFCAVHAIRRARSAVPHKPPARYNVNQRLYHWGNLLLLALVAVSGGWLFFRNAPQGILGFTWLDIHAWTGLLFLAGVIFHAFSATIKGDWRSMLPRWRDLNETRIIWRNFLGRTNEYPVPGKYDALQKVYHHLLSLLAVTFGVSGIWMWLSAERIHLAERSWLHAMRIVHDGSALLLIIMVIGHFYFSVIKANRANLKDMTGIGDPDRAHGEAAD